MTIVDQFEITTEFPLPRMGSICPQEESLNES